MKSSVVIADSVCSREGHNIVSLQETILENNSPVVNKDGAAVNKSIVLCTKCGTPLEKIQKSRSPKKGSEESPVNLDEVK